MRFVKVYHAWAYVGTCHICGKQITLPEIEGEAYWESETHVAIRPFPDFIYPCPKCGTPIDNMLLFKGPGNHEDICLYCGKPMEANWKGECSWCGGPTIDLLQTKNRKKEE